MALRFQITDWYYNDINSISNELLPTRDEPEDPEIEDDDAEYRIVAFGKTIEGKTVAAHLTNFKPYFFVECPQKWKDYQFKSFFYEIKRRNKFSEEVLDWEIVQSRKFYGFTNKEKFRFLKVRFASQRAWYKSRSFLQYNGPPGVKLYESNIDPFLRLIHIQDLDACGVVEINKYKDIKKNDQLTTCDIEVTAKYKYIKKVVDERPYPIKILAFDIECSSIDGHSFPKAIRDEENIEELRETCDVPKDYVGDSVTQIGLTTSIYGQEGITKKHIICLGKTDDIKGATVDCHEKEEDVLLAFPKYMLEEDPDIVTGYNIYGFDNPFLRNRADVLGILEEFSVMGKFKDKKCQFVRKNLSSSALGNNTLNYFQMAGRVIIDMMKVVMRDHKLLNYKLETASQKFLGVGKNDVTHLEIFAMMKGTSADRKRVAEYCIQDCALCNRLMRKLDILPNNMNMGNVCSVPLSFIFLRGQGIKVFSLIAKFCREEGYLIKVLTRRRLLTEEEKAAEKLYNSFKGAFVLDPEAGYYKDSPIVVCDFSSLYPSCMIAENLSQDTWVNDPKYDKLPGVEYIDKVYLDALDRPQKARFVCKREKDGNIKDENRGILPKILIKLLGERKKAKKQMKLATEAFKKSLYNGKQLALKVTCNSVYGFCGAPTSQGHCKDIAGSTTAEGRNLLLLSKKHVEDNYPGSKCIYGDSVLGDEPVITRTDDIIEIKRIRELNNQWAIQGDKEVGYVDTEVWSHTGWNKIQKVIRHKVNKKLYAVSTDLGSVVCTEDHSLLDENVKKIKPNDLDNTKLLHHSLPKIKSTKEFSDEDVLNFVNDFIK